MKLDFADRDVVVTGAGGALGAAVVRMLLAQGATCHLPARRAIEPERFGPSASRSVRARAGVDLTDEAAVRAFYGELPGLWASIHCAGAFMATPIERTSSEGFSSLMAQNAFTAFLCCREAVKRIRSARPAGATSWGRLVNVTARAALEPRSGGGMAAYAASKAAVAALTEALAQEVAAEGLWVNAVAPSIMDTPANRAAMPDADPSHWASVDDVAASILFLASPENTGSRGGVLPTYGKS